jgi:hemerythrin
VAIGSWTEELSVGDARLDAQHRSIFELAAAAEADLAQGRGEDLRRILAFLRRYVMQHFAAEEALLERAGYAQRDGHLELHRELSRQVVEAEARFQEGDPRSGEPVLEALARIIDHIRVEDALYRGCLRALSRPRQADGHPLGRSLLAVEEDHHRLFQHIRALREEVRAGRGRNGLDALLPQLEGFCRDHFRREELLMEISGYPGAERHCEGHCELRDGLATLAERHHDGSDVSTAMLGLLDRWSLQHLTSEDFQLASYLWSPP